MNHTFTNRNSWCTVKVGKAEIVLNGDDTISHLNHGRVSRVLHEAADYVAARPKLAAAVREFIAARREAAAMWKHETPHFRYDCDGGALAVRVNGATIRVGNRCGDGNHPVYILNHATGETMPPEFRPNGVSIDGPAKLEVMDYDCKGAKILKTVDIDADKSAWFHVGNGGAVAITIVLN